MASVIFGQAFGSQGRSSFFSSSCEYYPALTGSDAADSDSGSDSSSASTGRVKPSQPIPIPGPSKSTVEYLNPASNVAENLRKASAAATAAYNDRWHHRRHRQPGHDSRVKRQVETQGDYKIGKGGYARIKEGETLNHGRYEVRLLLLSSATKPIVRSKYRSSRSSVWGTLACATYAGIESESISFRPSGHTRRLVYNVRPPLEMSG